MWKDHDVKGGDTGDVEESARKEPAAEVVESGEEPAGGMEGGGGEQ